MVGKPSPGCSAFEWVVPPGAVPGQTFNLVSPSGKRVVVCIPAGKQPGDSLLFEVDESTSTEGPTQANKEGIDLQSVRDSVPQPSPGCSAFEWVVPPGAVPGQTFNLVSPSGKRVVVCIPAGKQPGDSLFFELDESPSTEGSTQANQEELFQWTVPPGAVPGQQFSLVTPYGKRVAATIPAGKRPGEVFFVRIAEDASTSKPETPPARSPPPAPIPSPATTESLSGLPSAMTTSTTILSPQPTSVEGGSGMTSMKGKEERLRDEIMQKLLEEERARSAQLMRELEEQKTRREEEVKKREVKKREEDEMERKAAVDEEEKKRKTEDDERKWKVEEQLEEERARSAQLMREVEEEKRKEEEERKTAEERKRKTEEQERKQRVEEQLEEERTKNAKLMRELEEERKRRDEEEEKRQKEEARTRKMEEEEECRRQMTVQLEEARVRNSELMRELEAARSRRQEEEESKRKMEEEEKNAEEANRKREDEERKQAEDYHKFCEEMASRMETELKEKENEVENNCSLAALLRLQPTPATADLWVDETLRIVVPPGAVPGERIQVDRPSREPLLFVIPPGKKPGEVIDLTLKRRKSETVAVGNAANDTGVSEITGSGVSGQSETGPSLK